MNKIILASIFSISFLLFTGTPVTAQTDSTEFVKSKIYVITTMNGGQFVGTIVSDDSKEVVIKTKDRGEVSIPKYEVKSMKELVEGELNSDGDFIGTPLFATRYFITTNAFPMEKGDNYYSLNLFGPEFHFGVGEKFGIGVMTSWVGIPIIGTAKYSINLGKKANLGIGALVGTGSWAAPEFFAALPFGVLTFGDERKNINFSAGYGVAAFSGNGSEGTALLSVAGALRMGDKASFVFDTFILPNIKQQQYTYNQSTGQSYYTTTNTVAALIIPGFRFQTHDDKAFQIGFAGIFYDGTVVPAPIPMVTWFRKL